MFYLNSKVWCFLIKSYETEFGRGYINACSYLINMAKYLYLHLSIRYVLNYICGKKTIFNLFFLVWVWQLFDNITYWVHELSIILNIKYDCNGEKKIFIIVVELNDINVKSNSYLDYKQVESILLLFSMDLNKINQLAFFSLIISFFLLILKHVLMFKFVSLIYSLNN